MSKDRTCCFDGCANPVRARGWCAYHYQYLRRRGLPLVVEVNTRGWPILDRFHSRIFVGPHPQGCIVWRKPSTQGYGTFSVDGRSEPAYRFAYRTFVGPIPDGLELDHLCRNRACVNTAHLEPVTHAENIRRGQAAEATKAHYAAQTHCKHGHEFTPENTYFKKVDRVKRECRKCNVIRQRNRRSRRGQVEG